MLFTAAPKFATERQQHVNELIKRSLAHFLRREALASLVPLLVSDCRGVVSRLASPASLLPYPVSPPTGILNPFDVIYRLIYGLTMRAFGCREIAEDDIRLRKTLSAFEGIEDAEVGSRLLFPWVPTVGKVKRVYAGARIYTVFKEIVEGRTREGRREEDPLQVLIDQGLSLAETMTVS